MKLKSNWSCTNCGMSSSRRSSVKRHVRTLHQGMGGIIPFIEYVSGRRVGKYPPQERARFNRSVTPLIDKVMAEIVNDFTRKIAYQVNPPAGDPVYSDFAQFFRKKNYDDMYKDLLRDLQKNF
jgi:hypothetical protein